MATFETVPIGELKTPLPAKLMPLVEEFEEKLEKLSADEGGKLGSLSFYLDARRGRRGRPPRPEPGTGGADTSKRRRGRPRKSAS